MAKHKVVKYPDTYTRIEVDSHGNVFEVTYRLGEPWTKVKVKSPVKKEKTK